MTEFGHIPVLPEETIDSLAIVPDGVYIDGTAGGGGHSLLIAERLSEKGWLIAIDQDGEAIEAAIERLSDYPDRVTVVRSNYRTVKQIMDDMGIPSVNGILLDIGVSSHQIDEAERGFSYMLDGPLDMRMDKRNPSTAADIVNGYTREELIRIIKEYGEERFAVRIADAIVRERDRERIETTGRLAEIIRGAVPGKAKYTGGNPAMRTFQALRIETNRELEVLGESLDMMVEMLKDRGRLSVITFHSLEDRIVKEAFRRYEKPCICPPEFPVCVCGRIPKGRCVNRKPVTAGEKELRENPRAHSAKLRTFEVIKEDTKI